MDRENVFEFASRHKLRFPFRGQICTEDLWDLDLEALNSIYATLYEKLKKTEEFSLLKKGYDKDDELSIQMEIIEYIFDTKKEEAANAVKNRQNKERRQKILSIIEDKQEESLRNMTTEQLQEMLNDL